MRYTRALYFIPVFTAFISVIALFPCASRAECVNVEINTPLGKIKTKKCLEDFTNSEKKNNPGNVDSAQNRTASASSQHVNSVKNEPNPRNPITVQQWKDAGFGSVPFDDGTSLCPRGRRNNPYIFPVGYTPHKRTITIKNNLKVRLLEGAVLPTHYFCWDMLSQTPVPVPMFNSIDAGGKALAPGMVTTFDVTNLLDDCTYQLAFFVKDSKSPGAYNQISYNKEIDVCKSPQTVVLQASDMTSPQPTQLEGLYSAYWDIEKAAEAQEQADAEWRAKHCQFVADQGTVCNR